MACLIVLKPKVNSLYSLGILSNTLFRDIVARYSVSLERFDSGLNSRVRSLCQINFPFSDGLMRKILESASFPIASTSTMSEENTTLMDSVVEIEPEV